MRGSRVTQAMCPPDVHTNALKSYTIAPRSERGHDFLHPLTLGCEDGSGAASRGGRGLEQGLEIGADKKNGKRVQELISFLINDKRGARLPKSSSAGKFSDSPVYSSVRGGY
jgi:hypothetical protein